MTWAVSFSTLRPFVTLASMACRGDGVLIDATRAPMEPEPDVESGALILPSRTPSTRHRGDGVVG